MSTSPPRVIELVEYELLQLQEADLEEEDARLLSETHEPLVNVDIPSFKNARHWGLRSQGFVGYLPVSERLGLLLKPKLPLQSLFGMFEYVYKVKMQFFPGLFDSGSLAEFYEHLALVLAGRVLDRRRKGLYGCYVPRTESLGYLRGTLDLKDRFRRPWAPDLQCDYEEHTTDIDENRILAWTLSAIGRSGLCSDRSLPTVSRAYRTMAGSATLQTFTGIACLNRTYNRLNEDYAPLHALCRFFLDNLSATHEHGTRRMLPFVVNMNRLFEQFVAEWLRQHLPPSFELRYQQSVSLGTRNDLAFRIDMLICEQATGRPLLVMDAKYKTPEGPSLDDVAQVIAYAEAVGCQRAALVYPKPLSRPLQEKVGTIEVASFAFGVSASLEEGGAELLKTVLAWVEGAERPSSRG